MEDRVAGLPQSRFERHPKKTIGVVLLFFLVVLEILLRVLAVYGIFPYQRYPTSFKPVYWDDIDPVIGTWRYPNAELRHISPCFDVVYRSNSYGARDVERERRSRAPRRVVVLGDSFVEGFGVKDDDRLTDMLEKRTGVEHLNFGSAGGFGSIQEWLTYKRLASRFDHTDLFIFTLPCNDFEDNDPSYYPADRYRPYLKGKNGQYELYYPVSFEKRQRFHRSRGTTIRNIIDNNVYLANFLRRAIREAKVGLGLKNRSLTGREAAFYDRFTREDLDKLFYTYEQILRIAGDRRVYLFTIPVEEDFNAALNRGYDFRLVTALKDFASKHPNLFYRDLLEDFVAHARRTGSRYRDYTVGCDRHWSRAGHQVAADAVHRFVYGEP
jgi:lysophospholipase L1-like esterase